MNNARILVVDDDPDVRQAAVLALMSHFGCCNEVSGPADAIAALQGGEYDALVLDMNFLAGERDGGAGLDALNALRTADSSVGIVFVTAYGGVALAVEAMKRGGDDFILKPWRNAQLIAAVTEAVRRTRSRRNAPTLQSVEQATISQALDRHNGNIARAAAALGLTRQALYRRLAKDG